jgi:acetyl-CoA carboxylase biotin carboxyl carrier protein
MFKFEELCALIRLVGSTDVAVVEVEHAGGRLRIEGRPAPSSVATVHAPSTAAPGPVVSAATAQAPTTAQPAAPGGPAADDEEGLHYVVSPIVGTFYRAPNPDAEPYVKVGDAVDRGRTLCIVEAMKLMNEIDSDVEGTVVKVFPDNSQPVEYGERLFAIRVT